MIHQLLHRTGLLLVLGALLIAAGCGKKADDAADALSSPDGVLGFIPADTPYAFVNVEPIDDDLVRRMAGEAGVMFSVYEMIIDDVLNENLAEIEEGSEEYERAERTATAIKGIMNLFSIEGAREAGLAVNDAFALYGNGILPVLRLRLLDADRFEAAVSEIEADEPMQTATLRGQSYRYFGDEDVRVLVGAFGDWVVATIAPMSFDEDQLAELVGLEAPARNLAEAGTLAEIAREYGYGSNYIGFADTRRLVGTFVDEPTGLNAGLLAMAESELEELTDVCRAELREMAEIAPRAVFGYSQIDNDGIDGSAVIELRSDLATGLAGIATNVPGLGADLGKFMTVGMGFDPMALREFFSARLDAIEADPYECEGLLELNASVAQGRALLNQPVFPKVYDFRGFLAIVDEFDVSAMASGVPPMDAEATVMVAVEDAPSLLLTGAMLSPELAALDIQPDGVPVAIELPQTAMLPAVPYAALTDATLAVSIGPDAQTRIQAVMEAAPASPPPVFSFAADAGRYYDMIGLSMATPSGEDEPLSSETMEALAGMMEGLADLYDRMQGEVYFTERGIEIGSRMSFKD